MWSYMQRKRVYVYQFGAWFSIAADDWLKACQAGAKDDLWVDWGDLGKQISPPYSKVWNAGAQSSSRVVPKPGVYIAVMPCDWDADTWKAELSTATAFVAGILPA